MWPSCSVRGCSPLKEQDCSLGNTPGFHFATGIPSAFCDWKCWGPAQASYSFLWNGIAWSQLFMLNYSNALYVDLSLKITQKLQLMQLLGWVRSPIIAGNPAQSHKWTKNHMEKGVQSLFLSRSLIQWDCSTKNGPRTLEHTPSHMVYIHSNTFQILHPIRMLSSPLPVSL